MPARHHPIGPVTSGLLRGIEDGWFTGEIADAAFDVPAAWRRATSRWSGVKGTPTRSRRRWRSCGCRTRSSGAGGSCWRCVVRRGPPVGEKALRSWWTPHEFGVNLVPAHRCRAGRGHARRDVQRAAGRLGHLPSDLMLSSKPAQPVLPSQGQTFVRRGGPDPQWAGSVVGWAGPCLYGGQRRQCFEDPPGGSGTGTGPGLGLYQT